MVQSNQVWEPLQRLGVPLHFKQVVKVMYTTICAKVQINDNTYDEVMSDIGVKQGCPLSPTLFGQD